MKKILVMLGLAAAAWGVLKMVRGSDEDEFNLDTYAAQPQA